MTPEDIRALLTELGQRLAARGVDAELYVVGGAAMALAYSSRRSTRDIDVVFRPRDEVLDEVKAMSREHRIPPNWLNDAVRDQMPAQPDAHPREVGRFGSVSIRVASPEYLLAMKAFAARMGTSDLEDAAALVRHLGITEDHEAVEAAERAVGASLGSRELFIEEAVAEAYASQPESPPVPPALQSRIEVASGNCGFWMKRAGRPCSLSPNHRGQHR